MATVCSSLLAARAMARSPWRDRFAALAVCLLASCFLAGCDRGSGDTVSSHATEATGATEKVLNLYIWNDYIDESVLKDFTAETGIKVEYDVFESSETLETKLLVGNSGFDVVVPGAPFLGRQIQAGVFQPLDKSRLDNWRNLDPELLKLLEIYDPGNAYSIPYLWGTTGLGFNVKKVKAILGDAVALDSYDMVFKPENISKLQQCGVAFLDAPGEVEGAALNYLGKQPGSLIEADYLEAEKLLTAVRPYIRYFNNSQYVNDLASGEICAAVGWNGDVLQAARRAEEAGTGQQIAYFIPREGTEVWIDTLAIPKDAPHPQNAMLFINYIMRPDVVAKISNFVAYPNGNLASKKLVSAELTGNPNVYPTAEVRARLYAVPTLPGEIDRVIARSWTRITTGH